MSQVTQYRWDEESRMVGVTNPDLSVESFTYAGDGQRRSKSTLSDLINYVWDEENVLQEVDGNTNQIKAHYTDSPGYWGGLTSLHIDQSTPTTTGAQFNTATFGSAGFNQAASGSSAASHFYLFDQSANTRFLTDDSGNVTDNDLYRAFGRQLVVQGSTRNPHGFQGRVGPITDALNRVWMGHRIYDADTGTWFSTDPIGFEGLDWNVYRFVGNNAIRWTDSFGLRDADDPHYMDRNQREKQEQSDAEFLRKRKQAELSKQSFGSPIGALGGYGHWCGLRNHGQKGAPIDCADKCCMHHDNCLARLSDFCDADKQIKCNIDCHKCTNYCVAQGCKKSYHRLAGQTKDNAIQTCIATANRVQLWCKTLKAAGTMSKVYAEPI